MQSIEPVSQRPLGKFVSLVSALAVGIGLASGLASNASAASEDVTVTGSIASTITLVLPASSFSYGALTPDNSGTPGSGVTRSSVDDDGATYTYALGNVVVRSNAVWGGTVDATLTSADTGLTVSDMSLVDTSGARAFGGTTPLAFGDPDARNRSTYSHSYALRVGWDDTAGTFGGTITYSVTNR